MLTSHLPGKQLGHRREPPGPQSGGSQDPQLCNSPGPTDPDKPGLQTFVTPPARLHTRLNVSVCVPLQRTRISKVAVEVSAHSTPRGEPEGAALLLMPQRRNRGSERTECVVQTPQGHHPGCLVGTRRLVRCGVEMGPPVPSPGDLLLLPPRTPGCRSRCSVEREAGREGGSPGEPAENT
uniref:Uncharacterized protein n=1 Tax=Rangifer tarandus platyrhynchus TaxID=3082113 RepID=A0ACB0FFZ9_RANTA|nr:unnamed protein product [Rangifer tarandus platyrhynchus]